MGKTSGTRKKSVHGAGSGPGQGPGWGGSAKGAHEAIEAVPVAENIRMMDILKITDPEEYARRKAKNVDRKDRAAMLESELFDVAMDIDIHAATRVQAMDKALDRLQGKPTQRTELAGVDGQPLKLEQIRRVIIDPKPIT